MCQDAGFGFRLPRVGHNMLRPERRATIRGLRGSTESGADIPRVEGACHGGVFGAFEDSAAIGKDGHFVRSDVETKKKVILADFADNGSQS